MDSTLLEKAIDMIKNGSDMLYAGVEDFLQSAFDTKIDYVMFEIDHKTYQISAILGLGDGTTEAVEIRAFTENAVSSIYELPKFLRRARKELDEKDPEAYKSLKRDVQKALIREVRSIWNELKGRRTYRQAYARFQNRSKALDFVTGKWVDVDDIAIQ